MAALRVQLREHSTLPDDGNKPLEAMLGVPANANSNQRFLTTEAAREAGFEVLGLLNEPSAAAVEFAHRDLMNRKGRSGGRLLVYDLGGGTFDASLIELGDGEHSIVASDGIPTLGGDDFDEILAELALEAAGDLSRREGKPLRCGVVRLPGRVPREKGSAQSQHAQTDRRSRTRAAQLARGLSRVQRVLRTVPSADRIDAPVVDELLAEHPERPIDSLYVTGGGSELPPVARILRESYGTAGAALVPTCDRRRPSDWRSGPILNPAACCATASCGISDCGERRTKGAASCSIWFFPAAPSYRAPNNRRCAAYALTVRPTTSDISVISNARGWREDGRPVGEITDWDDIRFPFDPELKAVPTWPPCR